MSRNKRGPVTLWGRQLWTVSSALYQLYVHRRQLGARVPDERQLRPVVPAKHPWGDRLRADPRLLHGSRPADQSACHPRSDVVRTRRSILQSVCGTQLRREDARCRSQRTPTNVVTRSVCAVCTIVSFFRQHSLTYSTLSTKALCFPAAVVRQILLTPYLVNSLSNLNERVIFTTPYWWSY